MIADPEPADLGRGDEIAATMRFRSMRPKLRASPEQLPLLVLCATETGERFAFYGLRSLLIAYLLQQVLPLGGEATGLGVLSHALAKVGGPDGPGPLASRIYGLYTALVYFLPLLGGYLADRLLPRTLVVATGAVLMACALVAMTKPAACLPALLLLCIGTGLLKGNISVQVGDLYPDDDRKRARGYAIFYLGINVGAFLGPIVCGALALRAGWRAGFDAGAAGMLLSLAIYLVGRRTLPTPASVPAAPRAAGLPWQLPVVALAAACLWTSYEEQGNAMVRWLSDETPQNALCYAWLQSIPSLVVLLGTPPLGVLWRRAAKDPGRAQMLIGAGLMVASQVLLAGLAAFHPGVPAIAGLVVYLVLWELGDLHFTPAAMGFFSGRAPGGRGGIVMACWFLTFFVGNLFAGFYGAYWGTLSPAAFWLLAACVAALSLPLLLVASRRRATRSVTGEPCPCSSP